MYRTIHMCLYNSLINLSVWDWNINSSLRVLTLESDSRLRFNNRNRNKEKCDNSGKIETLRFINANSRGKGIFQDTEWISFLNLQNSVKNVVIEVEFCHPKWQSEWTSWKKIFEN